MIGGQKLGLSIVEKPGGERGCKTVRATSAVVNHQRLGVVRAGAGNQAQGQ